MRIETDRVLILDRMKRREIVECKNPTLMQSFGVGVFLGRLGDGMTLYLGPRWQVESITLCQKHNIPFESTKALFSTAMTEDQVHGAEAAHEVMEAGISFFLLGGVPALTEFLLGSQEARHTRLMELAALNRRG